MSMGHTILGVVVSPNGYIAHPTAMSAPWQRMPVAAESERRLRAGCGIATLLARADSSRVVRAWIMGLNPQLDDESPGRGHPGGGSRRR